MEELWTLGSQTSGLDGAVTSAQALVRMEGIEGERNRGRLETKPRMGGSGGVGGGGGMNRGEGTAREKKRSGDQNTFHIWDATWEAATKWVLDK